jgi:hypothetical protein
MFANQFAKNTVESRPNGVVDTAESKLSSVVDTAKVLQIKYCRYVSAMAQQCHNDTTESLFIALSQLFTLHKAFMCYKMQLNQIQ